MNKESEKKKRKNGKKKKLKGRKSGLASTCGGAAWAPASVEAGLVTCAQVIRPSPKESWEYVGAGLRHMSGLTLLLLEQVLGRGPIILITKPRFFSQGHYEYILSKICLFETKFDISHLLLHWTGGQ